MATSKKKETDIPKVFEPEKIEDQLYAQWEKSGFFSPDKKAPGEPFSIAMPPPNATGILHIGHALFATLQDIMTRHARMQHRPTLWLPGTDHAAIATESRVAKQLTEETGKSKHDLGRDEFLKRVYDYVANSQGTIKKQLRKVGASCDWTRERYTLDTELSRLVQEVFIKMYQDGLIYRGHRIVNWDPALQTTVADDEIEYIEEKAPFYRFQYGPFIIGTARPETKFGDKYIVVHPNDARYKKYKDGETFECEWINGTITAAIIKDKAADPEFGTGAMTITPWHDATDFDIAERHNLDREQIIDLNGKLLPIAAEFTGTDITQARKKIVNKLKEKGLLVDIDEDYVHNLATNYRGGGIIEPQIMEQWFVSVDTPAQIWKGKKRSLKEIALDAVRSGDIDIIPERFKKTYFHWMENLHDWCISRQIWFGHRIPVWYNTKNRNEFKVQITSPEKNYTQDPDTLDTWFSSAMWTFSTLFDKPKKTDTLDTWLARNQKTGTDFSLFHPTSVLETAYEILFFWVARMILMTTYVTGDIPFKTVYLHGLVRDKQGRKMSKSLNNGIDPIDMVEKYGADATRLSLVIGNTPGNDSRMYEEKIAGFRNFVNKIWNIARFILINKQSHTTASALKPEEYTFADTWILSRLQWLKKEVTGHYDAYEFSLAGEKIYDFLWHELADWYVELAKTQDHSVAPEVLFESIQLLHPFTPFITEEIFKRLKQSSLIKSKEQWLATTSWPEVIGHLHSPKTEKEFSAFQELVTAIRDMRAQYKLPYSQKLDVAITTRTYKKRFQSLEREIEYLTKVRIQVLPSQPKDKEQFLRGHTPHADIFLKLSAQRMREQELQTEKEKEHLAAYIATLEKKLRNKQFVTNAPEHIVTQEKEKLAQAKNKFKKL